MNKINIAAVLIQYQIVKVLLRVEFVAAD